MDNQRPLGLQADDCAVLCKELNALLCDLNVFCQNVRGFRWNLQGQNFFELQPKFEEFRAELHDKMDEVAERILTLLAIDIAPLLFRARGEPSTWFPR